MSEVEQLLLVILHRGRELMVCLHVTARFASCHAGVSGALPYAGFEYGRCKAANGDLRIVLRGSIFTGARRQGCSSSACG